MPTSKRARLSHAIKTIVWPRRKLMLVGLLLIIVGRLAGLALPGASKYLIDVVIVQKDLHMLKILLLAVIGAITLQACVSFLLTRLLSVEAQRLISILRLNIQKKILSMPIQFFNDNRSGELVSRIMNDVEGVRNLVGTGVVNLVGGFLTASISLFLLIRISPLMTLYVLVPILLFGFIALKAFGYIRPIFRERGKINAEVTGRLAETLNGIRIVKGFDAEAQEIKSFEQGVERLFLNVKKSLTSTGLVTGSGAFLLGLASVAIMGIGGYMIIEGRMTFGDFLAFTLYLGFMIAPIVQMSNTGSQLTEALAGLDRMEEIMAIPPESDPAERIVVLSDIRGNVSFRDVSFSYLKDQKKTLERISFDAPAGSVTALVGSSGAGKTTIINLIASFIAPDEGLITVDGEDLSKVALKSYRSRLGLVLQDDFLFEGTIRGNILFARPHTSEARLLEAVRAAHIPEFADRMPHGLDTLIGERGVKLSGGQRQRLAIARAILADPKILILDEATSNLDTESEAFIQESLSKLTIGRTTFVIAHRLSTIRRADQILVVERGQILERGKHEELIAHRGRYFDLYTHQARI